MLSIKSQMNPPFYIRRSIKKRGRNRSPCNIALQFHVRTTKFKEIPTDHRFISFERNHSTFSYRNRKKQQKKQHFHYFGFFFSQTQMKLKLQFQIEKDKISTVSNQNLRSLRPYISRSNKKETARERKMEKGDRTFVPSSDLRDRRSWMKSERSSAASETGAITRPWGRWIGLVLVPPIVVGLLLYL